MISLTTVRPLPVIGVVKPGARVAARETPGGNIGVIGRITYEKLIWVLPSLIVPLVVNLFFLKELPKADCRPYDCRASASGGRRGASGGGCDSGKLLPSEREALYSL